MSDNTLSTTGTARWPVDNVFVHTVTVGPDDIDGMNHTNNARYVNWCEEAAWRHSDELGLTVADFQRLDRAMILRRSRYDYERASFRGDCLRVGTWLSRAKGTRIDRDFLVLRESDGEVILQGRWQMVCIAISSARPKRLPKEFIETYLPQVQAQESQGVLGRK